MRVEYKSTAGGLLFGRVSRGVGVNGNPLGDFVRVRPGVTVLHDGGPVYATSNPADATLYSGPLTTNQDGEVPGWLNPGTYTTTDPESWESVTFEVGGGTRVDDLVEEVDARFLSVESTQVIVDPALADDSTNATPAIQAAHDSLPATGGVIMLPGSATYKLVNEVVITKPNVSLLFPEASIRQSVWGRQAIDVQANGVTVEGYRIYSTEPRVALPGVYRGQAAMERSCAVYVNADNVAVRVRRASGFFAGVELTNWNGTDLTGAQRFGNSVKGMQVHDVWSGLKSINQSDMVIDGISGTYDDVMGSGAPAHVVYVGLNQMCKNVTVTNISGWDSNDTAGSGHVVSYKGVVGGVVQNITARNCTGVCAFSDCTDITGGNFVSVDDKMPIPGISCYIHVNCARVKLANVIVRKATGIESRSFHSASPDCSVTDLTVEVEHTTVDSVSSDIEIAATAPRCVIDGLTLTNRSTVGGWRSLFINGADCYVRIKKAQGVAYLARVVGAGTVLAYDPAQIAYGSATVSPSPLIITTGTTRALLAAKTTRQTITSNVAVIPQADGETARVITADPGAANFTVHAPTTPFDGAELLIGIVNNLGTVFATITWHAVFDLRPNWEPPGIGEAVHTRFRYDATASKWREIERSPVGAPTILSTNAAFTLTPRVSGRTIIHTGTLTANRAVTLSTTNAAAGDRFKITRTGGGAFTLDVGTGPLKALATGTWGEFTYDGTAWMLSAYGAL
jgi:hypothetical protein